VAVRPLEAPRALPAALHPMAAAISGRARPPLYTTGPNTRHALVAAGALGATTGTVVHLPSPPASVLSGVLAHELTHTRSPVRRPRFMLDGGSGLLDDDERQALAAGRQAASAGAGIVESLPVGGGLGAVGEVATRAAKAAVLEAAAGPIGNGRPGGGFAGGFPGGGFDSGGFGGAGDNSGGFGGFGGAGGGFGGGGSNGGAGFGGADSAAGDASVGGWAADGGAMGGSAGGGGVAGGGSAGGGAAGGAAGTSGAGRGAVVGSGVIAGDAASAPLDPDQVVAIVEQRLLREIERRGGRWQGVF
jgi:hypothetical protein